MGEVVEGEVVEAGVGMEMGISCSLRTAAGDARWEGEVEGVGVVVEGVERGKVSCILHTAAADVLQATASY